jgi:hypothetical protein
MIAVGIGTVISLRPQPDQGRATGGTVKTSTKCNVTNAKTTPNAANRSCSKARRHNFSPKSFTLPMIAFARRNRESGIFSIFRFALSPSSTRPRSAATFVCRVSYFLPEAVVGAGSSDATSGFAGECNTTAKMKLTGRL